MITHKDHTVHTPRNLKSCFSFFAFLPYPRGLWRKQCVSSEVCFNFSQLCTVLLIPKDLADNRSPATQGCTIAIYISNFCVPDNSVGNTKLRRRLATEMLCLMIRRGTQSFVRDWRMSLEWGWGGSIQYENDRDACRKRYNRNRKGYSGMVLFCNYFHFTHDLKW